jgi:hypothetical protein
MCEAGTTDGYNIGRALTEVARPRRQSWLQPKPTFCFFGAHPCRSALIPGPMVHGNFKRCYAIREVTNGCIRDLT